MNFEGVEKHWLIDYIQIFQSLEFQSALTLCPLPAPNPVRFLASICWERVVLLQAGAAAPACKHLSPHQHRTESFTLKRNAGEGNQRGGAYEHMVIFLNIKLFFF